MIGKHSTDPAVLCSASLLCWGCGLSPLPVTTALSSTGGKQEWAQWVLGIQSWLTRGRQYSGVLVCMGPMAESLQVYLSEYWFSVDGVYCGQTSLRGCVLYSLLLRAAQIVLLQRISWGFLGFVLGNADFYGENWSFFFFKFNNFVQRASRCPVSVSRDWSWYVTCWYVTWFKTHEVRG